MQFALVMVIHQEENSMADLQVAFLAEDLVEVFLVAAVHQDSN